MDPEARFRALFTEHYAGVRRYAHHRGVVGPDADDLVADVFTVAWRRLADVPADGARPWLLAVAANVRRNQARSVRRYRAALRRLPAPQPAPPPPEPADAPLADALAALGADDREILWLVAWDGLSPREAAVVLGCVEGTARSRLHRARRRLAALLEAPPRRTPPAGQFEAETPATGALP